MAKCSKRKLWPQHPKDLLVWLHEVQKRAGMMEDATNTAGSGDRVPSIAILWTRLHLDAYALCQIYEAGAFRNVINTARLAHLFPADVRPLLSISAGEAVKSSKRRT